MRVIKTAENNLGNSTEIDTVGGKNCFFRTWTIDQDQMRLVNNSEIISLRKLIAIIFIEMKLPVIELSFIERSKNS